MRKQTTPKNLWKGIYQRRPVNSKYTWKKMLNIITHGGKEVKTEKPGHIYWNG